MSSARGQWRKIEQLLFEEPAPGVRADTWVQLRGDAAARGRYDQAIAALRLLENDAPIASIEIDMVQDWVLADVAAAETAAAEDAVPASWWRRLPLLFAVAAAVLLAVVLRPPPGPVGRDDAFAVRGADDRGRLAITALCGPADPQQGPLARQPCDEDDVLGFAYRVDPRAQGRVLVLFGVDADGDPMFYAPTPADEAPITVVAGDLQAVDTGVALAVNHAVGPLDVYAVLLPSAATVAQVRSWAARLAAADAGPSDVPWPQRIGDPELGGLCPTEDACDVAQLRLRVRSTR